MHTISMEEKINIFLRLKRAGIIPSGPVHFSSEKDETLRRIRRIGQLQQEFREEHRLVTMSEHRIEYFVREAAVHGIHGLRELDKWTPTDDEVEMLLDSQLVNHW